MFRRLMKGIAYAIEKAAQDSVSDSKPPLTVPLGKYRQTLYTYDWRGLERLTAGDTVLLRFDPAPCTLKSVYTGTVSDAPCSFTYNGKRIGCIFGSYTLDALQALAETNAVSAYAVCKAWNRAGYPELELRTAKIKG